MSGDPIPRWAAALGLAALVAYLAIARYRFLAASPYPFGVDGYFYAVELRSLLERGALHYPAAPLTFWLLAPLAAVGGAIGAVKVGAAIASAAIAIPIYGVGRELGAGRGPSLAAAAVAATSPASSYAAVELVKSGVGLVLATAALWALLFAARRGGRGRLALFAALALATWLAHKAGFALLLVAAGPYLWIWLPARGRLAAVALLAAALAAAALAPERLLGAGDLRLAGDLFSAHADLSLAPLRRADGPLAFGHEVPLAAAAAAALWALWLARGLPDEGRAARAPWVLAGPALLALVAVLPWIDCRSPEGPGFRLRLLCALPLALCLAPLLARLGRKSAAAGLGLAGFVVALRPAIDEAPVVEQPPALIAAVGAAAGLVPEGDVVITPERRLVFATTWLTGARAARRPAGIPFVHRWRLVPRAYAGPALLEAIAELRRAGWPDLEPPRSLHPYDVDGLLLMREATWDALLDRLPARRRAAYESWPVY